MERLIHIAVIGMGHVGLPTALGLADLGWSVAGTDTSTTTLAALAEGRVPFYEPGLEALLGRHLKSGRFRLASELAEAVRWAEAIFVCVGTPEGNDGTADLSDLEAVAAEVTRYLNGDKIIVEKSTAPVRTGERIREMLRRHAAGAHLPDVAVNPEFLREGEAVHDVLHPDRIVLGVATERARALLETIYRPLLERLPRTGECEQCDRSGRSDITRARLLVTDLTTAELIKHASNAYLATRVSFINVIADLCERLGVDVAQVAGALGLDPRIGQQYLRPGVGYGGSCLPKDLRAFALIAEESGAESALFRAVARINEARIDRLMEKINRILGSPEGKTVAILGLAFKPGTDDIREAPSLKVARRLLASEVQLRLHDPHAISTARAVLPEAPPAVVYCSSPREAASGAHLLLLLTDWEEYIHLDLARIRDAMASPALIDGRNVYDPAVPRSLGFRYEAIGRP